MTKAVIQTLMTNKEREKKNVMKQKWTLSAKQVELKINSQLVAHWQTEQETVWNRKMKDVKFLMSWWLIWSIYNKRWAIQIKNNVHSNESCRLFPLKWETHLSECFQDTRAHKKQKAKRVYTGVESSHVVVWNTVINVWINIDSALLLATRRQRLHVQGVVGVLSCSTQTLIHTEIKLDELEVASWSDMMTLKSFMIKFSHF